MSDSEIVIRDFTPDDEPFIFSSWLKSYWENSDFTEHISKHVFFTWHHKVIERILKYETAIIKVAALQEEPTVVIGYLCLQRMPSVPDTQILHFCYVKAAFRKLGIAKALIKAAQVNPDTCVFTHRTDPIHWWIQNMFPRLSYNPYLV